MKTTVEIPDTLLDEARKLAAENDTTLRALIHEGLRKIVEERKRRKPFRLRKASVKGTGLRPELEGASWEQIRDMSYEGRGT